ncbi:MAG: NAD(P)-dependent oxidoreductase, partial [bacterium]
MVILIIGSKGMLGKEIIKAFSDCEVIGWDKENIDITKKDEMGEKIKKLSLDLIINCAAYNNVDGCEENPDIANLINGYAVGFLAEISKRLDIPLVHFSTGYVFDGENGNYTEDMEPRAISKYAASKILGEKELADGTGKFYLIRTNLLFGNPGQAENSKKSFIELMLGLAQEKDKLQVVSDEISNPTYVKDLAEAVYKLVIENYPFGIYHLVNDGSASWYDWAKEIFKIKGLPVNVEPVSSDKFPRAA